MEYKTIARVLAIPELLDTIFRHLDDASNTTNALVSKKWSELALDTLWRNVCDLHRLFSLLCPLQEYSISGYQFSRLPESSDWTRFERYSKRVRQLTYNASKSACKLHHSVFDDIARTRTTLHILPNMHTLEWNAPLPLSVMFMSPNVKCFNVHLPTTMDRKDSFFQDVVARMPNITHLDIRSRIAINSMQSSIAKLFEGLVKLRKVVLPRYYFTSKIAESLSRLAHLGEVEFQYYNEQGCGDPNDTALFSPTLLEGAFPALWDLSITVGFNDTAQFLNMPYAPINLTMLYIDSHLIESPATVHNLLTVIAENCQLLKYLSLNPLRDPIFPDQPVESPNPPNSEPMSIGFTHLKPLLKCPCLTSLELVHQYPLDLCQDDIETLAASWPSLETLILNNEPVHFFKSNLTLQALLPFARHCPKLRHLGLFIHASTVDIQPIQQEFLQPTIPSSSTPPQKYRHQYFFANLKQLSMGVSIISKEAAGHVALFLSQLCPAFCELNCGVTWDESLDFEQRIGEEVQQRCVSWDKVAELLPLLVKLRREERDRVGGLVREVEELKMRNGVLADREGLALESSDVCVLV